MADDATEICVSLINRERRCGITGSGRNSRYASSASVIVWLCVNLSLEKALTGVALILQEMKEKD